jgi:ATP synthase protein I
MIRQLGVLSAAVILLACAILLGLFGGSWIDEQFLTAPFFTIMLSILGGFLGFSRLIKTVKNLHV